MVDGGKENGYAVFPICLYRMRRQKNIMGGIRLQLKMDNFVMNSFEGQWLIYIHIQEGGIYKEPPEEIQ
jgi:hypothetical protein